MVTVKGLIIRVLRKGGYDRVEETGSLWGPVFNYSKLVGLISSGKSGIVLFPTLPTRCIMLLGKPSPRTGSESTIMTPSNFDGKSVSGNKGKRERSKSNLLLKVGQMLGRE